MSVAEAHGPLPPVHVRRAINATQPEVFAAWTDPAVLATWLGSPEVEVTEAHIDPQIGGAYRVVMRGTDSGQSSTLFGTYKELLVPERLVFTWRVERSDGTLMPESLVTVDLVAVESSRTEIRLTHALLSTEDARRGVRSGWGASFDKLDKLLRPQHPSKGSS